MDVREYLAASAAGFSQALRQWLAIPSVSADPARHDDVRRSAQWLAAYLEKTGFPVTEVWETKGLPAVYAHWPAAGDRAPRVLVYGRLLHECKDELNPDVIVISDTTMWAADIPSICTGMRGLAEAEITVTGPARDLHSGSFGGGVPNPVHALAALLAGLHDEDGRG